jgi:hypothetical protein
MASPRRNPDGTMSMPILSKGSGVPLGYTGGRNEKKLIKKARSLDKQRKKAQREQRRANAQAKRAARKALTPAQRKQKRMAASKAKQAPALNPVPTSGPTLLGPLKRYEYTQAELDRMTNTRPSPKPTIPRGSGIVSMFSKGGLPTKNAKGHNDYRKSGTTLSSVDNRKKK